MWKKIEEIAKVINSLDVGDKIGMSSELKKSFDNGRSNNIYDKLLKIINRTERHLVMKKEKNWEKQYMLWK